MDVKCEFCNSERVWKSGKHKGMQRYQCAECKKYFDFGEYLNNSIVHFGVKIKVSERNKLSRENYCIPTNKCRKAHTEWLKDRIRFDGWIIPNETYADVEHYTDEWVQEQYDDCMLNFDLNMAYCNQISFSEFNSYLKRFTSANKFRKITNLNSVNEIEGLYILVLDEYKQVYIGKATNIKRRILQHWSAKKEFDRLLFGSVYSSVLSIDSFGALDTTRIFYKKMTGSNIFEQERKMVESFEQRYSLNRICGGLNVQMDMSDRIIDVISTMKKRDLL
ncbi:MAG: GIY-YIG nuclease family protein [Clostridia bacterium]|nr:GIY-YIG nuclease family protein [Clostridia bacterium]